ncbi:hypothetical protein TNCV_4884681 [Trichonephila clavipes]|nr:hypothetical protein TNCV_4884681 [Trichonephila clavipes]
MIGPVWLMRASPSVVIRCIVLFSQLRARSMIFPFIFSPVIGPHMSLAISLARLVQQDHDLEYLTVVTPITSGNTVVTNLQKVVPDTAAPSIPVKRWLFVTNAQYFARVVISTSSLIMYAMYFLCL